MFVGDVIIRGDMSDGDDIKREDTSDETAGGDIADDACSCATMVGDATECPALDKGDTCDVMWGDVMPCGEMWGDIMPCGDMWGDAMPCGDVRGDVMPCGYMRGDVITCASRVGDGTDDGSPVLDAGDMGFTGCDVMEAGDVIDQHCVI